MKILFAVALAALVTYVTAQSCTDVLNCDSCSNPGPKCEDCPAGTILTMDREECKTCGVGCANCTINSKDETTCVLCSKGYYLKDGACVACGDGCDVCHEDADGAVTCDECQAEGYTRKAPEGAPATCESCPANCRVCSMLADGTTVRCSACYDYKDQGIKGYYLKKDDFSCKSCPSYCEKCSDNGEGKGICSSCYANYTLLADSNQETYLDGEKCLKCPSTCSQCSGEIYSGTTAKCTDCYPENGLYLSDDQCGSCGTGCKSCDSEGLCTDCIVGYRLEDGGSCTACPALCDSCSYDADADENTCALCQDNYGPKAETSVSCDSCAFPNCGTCTRSSSGTFSCGGCKSGYAFNADQSQCVACPSGCKVCSWDSVLSNTRCNAGQCDTGYTDEPDSYDGTCDQCPSECTSCVFLDDGTGNYTTPINCTACDDTTTHHIGSYSLPAVCMSNINNCELGDPWDDTLCASASDCADGYESDTTCSQCLVSNCKTCTTDNLSSDGDAPLCDTCKDGYIKDATEENCLQCSVSNCRVCTAGNYQTECVTCNAGYIKSSDSTECLKCSSNCDVCSVSGSSTTCTTCQQYDADAGTKEYVKDQNGACKSCGTKCTSCTWDNSENKAICSACESGYVVNGNSECEACPSNCDDCEYDSTDAAVVCKSGQCSTGYGRKTDKFCYACPSNCDVCALGDADVVGDDVLICSDCKDSYATNNDVCAKCPTNCKVCQDNGGTMECTECKDGYDLYSADKTCQKCPSNCEKCTAGSTVTCNECKDGYALAGDKASCIDCATAAFENCAECTSVDAGSGKANCTECDTGFTLQDEEEYLACVDASALLCGLGDYSDNGPECSVCSGDFMLEDYICVKHCYACGDVDAGVYVEPSQCMIPNGNATENDAKLVSCPSGICYGTYKDGKIAAGCLPKDDPTGTCTGDRASSEYCSTTEVASKCERCCTDMSCNIWLQELDGLTDSAVSMATNVALLLVAAVMAAIF